MYTTYRIWDENDTYNEYNNRIYRGIVGYRWVVFKDGEQVDYSDIFRTFAEVKRKFPDVIKVKKQ